MIPLADPKNWTLREAAHLLNRAGFGGTPAEIAALHKRGRTGAVDHLLSFTDDRADFPKPDWANANKRDKLATYAMSRRELNDIEDPQERAKKRQQLQRERRKTQRQNTSTMVEWWLTRMYRTEHPLREKMTLFWHGHFATSIQKVKEPRLMLEQNETFRSHATGNFRKLTQAICLDPAMMLYLDTNQNRKGKPNENFARELFELFTLGEGHYTEQDIKEAARAFTGYQLNRRTGHSAFNRRQHDHGAKTVFGKTERFKGNAIVDLALAQPACAKFISTKVWEFFAYEAPDKELVAQLATQLRDSDYEIRPLLRSIFLSAAFYDDQKAIRTQIKSPTQFLVQLVRQLEIKSLPLNVAATTLSSLGQALFHPPNVAGWEGGKAWINTNTLLSRYNIAGLIVKGIRDPEHARSVMKGGDKRMMMVPNKAKDNLRRYRGPNYQQLAPKALRQNPSELVDALTLRLFQDPLQDSHRKSFDEYATSKQARAFTDIEVAELLHLMMSTPYFQLT